MLGDAGVRAAGFIPSARRSVWAVSWLLHNLPAPANGGAQIDFSVQEEHLPDLFAREAPWQNMPPLLHVF